MRSTAVGLRGDGRLLQLNSYENRVFQVLPGRRRRGGRQVLPARRAGATRRSSRSTRSRSSSPPTTCQSSRRCVLQPTPTPTRSCSASRRRWRMLTARYRFARRAALRGRGPELEDPDVLEWLGRFLGRLHAVGRRAPFAHRRTLDAPTLRPARAASWLLRRRLPARAKRCRLAARLRRARSPRSAQAFDARRPLRHAAPARRLPPRQHPVARRRGPHVVDLDDACKGPAVQDLWMLLSGDRAAMRAPARARCSTATSLHATFDDRELALIEPLRTLRMIRHSAWIAERWSDPAFPIAFPVVRHAGLLVAADRCSCASRSTRCASRRPEPA